jgi:hypothetical protein
MSVLHSARRHTGPLVIGDKVRRLSVIPAQAGIQRLRERHWVPASAGTTIGGTAAAGVPAFCSLGTAG